MTMTAMGGHAPACFCLLCRILEEKDQRMLLLLPKFRRAMQLMTQARNSSKDSKDSTTTPTPIQEEEEMERDPEISKDGRKIKRSSSAITISPDTSLEGNNFTPEELALKKEDILNSFLPASLLKGGGGGGRKSTNGSQKKKNKGGNSRGNTSLPTTLSTTSTTTSDSLNSLTSATATTEGTPTPTPTVTPEMKNVSTADSNSGESPSVTVTPSVSEAEEEEEDDDDEEEEDVIPPPPTHHNPPTSPYEKEIAQALLKGWTLLQETCGKVTCEGTPLFDPRNGGGFVCVGCLAGERKVEEKKEEEKKVVELLPSTSTGIIPSLKESHTSKVITDPSLLSLFLSPEQTCPCEECYLKEREGESLRRNEEVMLKGRGEGLVLTSGGCENCQALLFRRKETSKHPASPISFCIMCPSTYLTENFTNNPAWNWKAWPALLSSTSTSTPPLPSSVKPTAEVRRRENSRRIGQHMLEGLVLTDLPCGKCRLPTMRSQDSSITAYCVMCDNQENPWPLPLEGRDDSDPSTTFFMEEEEDDHVPPPLGNSQLMGRLLLNGWTMLEENCKHHAVPLMSNKKGECFCVQCDRIVKVIVVEEKVAAVAAEEIVEEEKKAVIVEKVEDLPKSVEKEEEKVEVLVKEVKKVEKVENEPSPAPSPSSSNKKVFEVDWADMPMDAPAFSPGTPLFPPSKSDIQRTQQLEELKLKFKDTGFEGFEEVELLKVLKMVSYNQISAIEILKGRVEKKKKAAAPLSECPELNHLKSIFKDAFEESEMLQILKIVSFDQDSAVELLKGRLEKKGETIKVASAPASAPVVSFVPVPHTPLEFLKNHFKDAFDESEMVQTLSSVFNNQDAAVELLMKKLPKRQASPNHFVTKAYSGATIKNPYLPTTTATDIKTPRTNSEFNNLKKRFEDNFTDDHILNVLIKVNYVEDAAIEALSKELYLKLSTRRPTFQNGGQVYISKKLAVAKVNTPLQTLKGLLGESSASYDDDDLILLISHTNGNLEEAANYIFDGKLEKKESWSVKKQPIVSVRKVTPPSYEAGSFQATPRKEPATEWKPKSMNTNEDFPPLAPIVKAAPVIIQKKNAVPVVATMSNPVKVIATQAAASLVSPTLLKSVNPQGPAQVVVTPFPVTTNAGKPNSASNSASSSAYRTIQQRLTPEASVASLQSQSSSVQMGSLPAAPLADNSSLTSSPVEQANSDNPLLLAQNAIKNKLKMMASYLEAATNPHDISLLCKTTESLVCSLKLVNSMIPSGDTSVISTALAKNEMIKKMLQNSNEELEKLRLLNSL